MQLTDDEMLLLQQACDKLDDGGDYRGKNFIDNLMITVLDFQMNVKTVKKARYYFMEKYPAIIENHDSSLPELKRILEKYPDSREDNLELAHDLWDNNHWSRAKFLRKLIECLEDRGVHDQATLVAWAKSADFEEEVKGQIKTEEHSMGIAIFKWLQLRCGVDTVKPDVHILNFIHKAVGRKVTPEVAVEVLEKIAENSNRKPNLLDAAIWKLGRDTPRKKKKKRKSPKKKR